MAVYSANRTHLGNYDSSEIVANENYTGAVGALQMVYEGLQEDQAVFEAVIGMDFDEIAAIHEGHEVVVSEATLGGFADKIKDFVKKAWEKIKGLFQTFLAKFNGVVMRDNKAFVEKYKRAVLSKSLTKMKYKYSVPKGDEEGLVAMTKVESGLISDVSTDMNSCISDSNRKSLIGDIDEGKKLESIYKKIANIDTDTKSFAKDFHESLFEDSEVIEGLDSTRLAKIINVLTSKKLISNVEKSKTACDKYFSNLLKEVDKTLKSQVKNAPSDKVSSYKVKMKDADGNDTEGVGSDSSSATSSVDALNAMYKVVSTYQAALNTYTGRYLAETKFHVAQCRGVFAKAVSFNPKAVKEDAIFVEAAGLAGEYEVLSNFEG